MSHPVLRSLGLAGAGAAAVLGYSLWEAQHPVIRVLDVPVLPDGVGEMTILHLSDLHLTGATERRVEWVRALARLQPDMVVNTGDNVSFASGVEPLRDALAPFAGIPGAFVMGDHDYHSTILRMPTRYLRADPRTANRPGEVLDELPWGDIRDIQRDLGWEELTNRRAQVSVNGQQVDCVGVDDPHAELDEFPPPVEYAQTSGQRPLRLGLTHAPYRRVLDACALDGVDLALAGHTHGGQLCLPGYGPLVSNADIDPRIAGGLSWWTPALAALRDEQSQRGEQARQHRMALHISRGLGTSPYTPVRLACRPEATLLRLISRRHMTA